MNSTGARRSAAAHVLTSRKRAAMTASCLGLAVLAARMRWLPGTAQAPPRVTKLSLSASAGQSGAKPQGCEAALSAGFEAFESLKEDWATASGSSRFMPSFGKVADTAERRALAAFDSTVEKDSAMGACTAQRAALLSAIRKEVWSEFLRQRQLAELDAGEELAMRLLQSMKRRGAPLRVGEKMDVLQQVVTLYGKQVRALLPDWAASRDIPEQLETERRLGELQFGIEDSAAGRALQSQWERNRAKSVMSERAHGFSVSLDPALRVMIRPEGLGNLQVFSTGPVGPPNQPATVNIGVMNDGSMADVYREHPVPPKLSVQPAVKINLNLR